MREIIQNFINRNPLRLLTVIYYFSFFLSFLCILPLYESWDGNTQVQVANITSLTLVFLSLYINKENEAVLIVVEIYAVIVSSLLTMFMLRANDNTFLNVFNFILGISIVPFFIFMKKRRFEERLIKLSYFIEGNTINCAPDIKKIPNANERFIDSLKEIPIHYAKKINKALMGEVCIEYHLNVKIENDIHLKKLNQGYFLLSNYYKKKGYHFSINQKKKEIVISWKNPL